MLTSQRNLASRFMQAMNGMLVNGAARITYVEGNNRYQPGNIVQTRRYHIVEPFNEGFEGLRLTQGYGKDGSVTFSFMFDQNACVLGHETLRDIFDTRFSISRSGRMSKSANLRLSTTDEVDKLIDYMQSICPQVSQHIHPEWHKGHN